ncbi:uncharacterized protein LOC129795013 [Lutzomyia longipalpis]|uniref:uncharacterized protein LOC129795013 n=1 Tax=Lutzomyia longipalpis TaxID=7200 RepID=UPI0024846F28|nr:uncharacterized protein LOC129795013 [Lutzomyia longipalpis]
MERFCIVNGCKSNTEKNFGVTLHGLPWSRLGRTLWINAIEKLNNQKIPKKYLTGQASAILVCQNHFVPEDYDSLSPRLLKAKAVPSLFGDKCNDHSSQVATKSCVKETAQTTQTKEIVNVQQKEMKKGTKKKGKFTKQPKYWVSTVTCSSAVCQVQGCTNRRLNCDSSINFHRLAGNAPDELLEAWSQFCFGVPYRLHCDLEVSSKRPIVVCSLHFEEGAFINNGPDYESQAYLQLKSDAIPTVKQSEVIGEVVQQGTLVAPEYISRDDETQETFYREDTGEYFVVQRVEGMDLQQEDEGTEYILSDDTDTLVVEGCSQEEEILIDEDNLYVLQDEGDELMEAYDDSIPPLLTFDGRLVSFMEEVREGKEDVKSGIVNTESSGPPTNLQVEVICNHMTACEKLEQENLALEEETKRLTERNGQLASTLRRMRSEMNEVYKCFSPIFTPGQMDRIRGMKDPWQKKDFERAMKLKILGPAAYKYLRKHYKFPLPSLRLLEIYESSCSSELEPIYKNMQAFQDIVRQRKCDKTNLKFRKSIHVDSMIIITTKPLK